MWPATTSTATQAVTSPKTAQPQQSHPRPPSAPNKPSPSSTPPKPQPPPTATVGATARPTTTMATSKVLPKALDINNNVKKQERDCWQIEAKQLKNEIMELKGRITQLEEENTKNLNLLHEERKQHATAQERIKEMKRIYEERETDNQQRFRELQQQWKHNSEMELQRLQEKTVSDMTAKNKELMGLEAHITTLEEESANNLKMFCDERESDQQRFQDLQRYTNHVMSHIEQGEGMWRNILPPENNKTNNGCKRSQLRIAFEHLPSFDEIVCGSCPLQMIVKLIVSKKFGVEPTQQVLFTGGSENNNSEELLPTDSSMTLDDIQQRQQQQISGSGSSSRNRSVVQIKVRIKSTMSIQEKDLKVVSTLGVGAYGTVFKCTFHDDHNAMTTSSSSSSSSSSERTPTFVAIKALHEAIKSEFNITRFQQEALVSSSLRHPNIVRCLGTCVTSTGSLWIVSELMEMSLRQLLQQKDLTFMEVVAVSSGIAKGMTALHRRKYMHRDLSSNNVLLDSCGTPKITDFGVSRALQQHQIDRGSKPAPIGSFTNGAGTPIYLPPQMHTGHYGIQGDMWEFAVLLSELLQREVPPVKMPKTGAQVIEFMRVQRASLSAPEIAEVDRICDDVGDYPVVECLSRKIAIISALRSEPKMNNNVHRACAGLFRLVVESCLSILEIDRPSFPAIDKVLMTCAEIVFTNSGPDLSTTTSTVNNNNNNAPTADDDVTGHISRCLANIAATFPGHRNHTEPTTATSSS
ncbi:Protein tyrosine and serine/threonine kinase [Pelomyxa schiedti]|nr:Protein tyrosine and serine/threonine kinase [Pelomyxa schiedti]